MHRTAALLIVLIALTACGKKARVQAPVATPGASAGTTIPPASNLPRVDASELEGIASYYAEPYHGRPTANGEIFDTDEALTAAHRTLPFNTLVRVTNKSNGREVEVRINDRGPFIDGRVIDLSRRAAREIDLVRTGISPVTLRVLKPGTPSPAAAGMPVYAVQVGAFERSETAEDLRDRLRGKYPIVAVERFNGDRTVFRVRVGRETDMLAAHKLAERIKKEEDLRGFVVRAN